MNSDRVRLVSAAATAGLAISLTLSACGPQPRAENPAAESMAPSATSARSFSPSAPPTSPPVPSVPATAAPSPDLPAQPVQPAFPAQPALKSFTFPDRHISFFYPASWSVRTQRGPGAEGPPWQPVQATISDGNGSDLLRVSSGASGVGCAAGPTRRTVFDKAAVPAMRTADGTTPEFGFIVDDSGHDWYTMAVMNPRNLEEGDVSSACTWLVMGNSGAEASVIFNEPAFASRAAAKAWMATEQYAQLKALLMSLSYS